MPKGYMVTSKKNYMNKIILIIIVIVIVAVGGYFLIKANNQTLVTEQSNNTGDSNTTVPTNTEQTNPNTNTPETPTQTATTHQVLYSNSGYSPSESKIKLGDTVTFKNESSSGMWTGSAMHPSHSAYNGTSLQQHCPDAANVAFDECKSVESGESWPFTFNKKGAFGYHNHMQATHFGKIIVE